MTEKYREKINEMKLYADCQLFEEIVNVMVTAVDSVVALIR